jgi:hypothetical protein
MASPRGWGSGDRCCSALEAAVDGRAGHREQLGQVGDGVLAAAVHAAQLGLLLGAELRGRLLADRGPEELLAQAVGRVWSVTCDPQTAAALQASHTVSGLVSQGARASVRVVSPEPPHPAAQPMDPTLEDAYLWIVGSGSPVAPPAMLPERSSR